MPTLQCVVCEKVLTGGLDTYGEPHFEMCWECYSESLDDPDLEQRVRDSFYIDDVPVLSEKSYRLMVDRL